MLDWKSEVLLAEGKTEEAVEAGLLVLQLSRLQAQEPGTVHGLVAVALRGYGVRIINRALRSGPLGADFRQALDAELATYDELDWFVRNLRTERAINLSASRDLFPHFPVGWQGTLLQADMLAFHDKFLPAAGEPYYISSKEFAELQQETYSTPISNSLIGLLVPAIDAAQVSANRDLALIRAANSQRAAGVSGDAGKRSDGVG